MLYIHVDNDKTKNVIRSVDYYFNSHKKKEWFNDPFVKRIIKEIDNTIAVKDEYMESPVFGGMSPDRLSTGCKALILMYLTDEIVFATRCGDNCALLLYEIAQKKDLHIMLNHCMPFPPDFPLHAIFVDSGKEVFTNFDYVVEFVRLRSGVC